jgi:hypothetical protein
VRRETVGQSKAAGAGMPVAWRPMIAIIVWGTGVHTCGCEKEKERTERQTE